MVTWSSFFETEHPPETKVWGYTNLIGETGGKLRKLHYTEVWSIRGSTKNFLD